MQFKSSCLDGELPDYYIGMGQTAENVAGLRGITRADQDEFALRSQTLAGKAAANGFWAREITPVTLPDGTVMNADEGPRPQTTLEGLSGLKPVFQVDGTVTAGNACPLNDGAAALVIIATNGPPNSVSRRWPGSSPPGCPPCPRRSWDSDRSRRAGGRWPWPA